MKIENQWTKGTVLKNEYLPKGHKFGFTVFLDSGESYFFSTRAYLFRFFSECGFRVEKDQGHLDKNLRFRFFSAKR